MPTPEPGIGGTGSEGRSSQEAREIVLDQLRYLVDELKAQVPLFERVDDSVLAERPFGNHPSILDRYRDMLEREETEYHPLVTGILNQKIDLPGGGETEDLVATEETEILRVLASLASMRRALVDVLDGIAEDQWSATVEIDGHQVSLLELGYRMAMADADSLREISMQLSEIQMLFRT